MSARVWKRVELNNSVLRLTSLGPNFKVYVSLLFIFVNVNQPFLIMRFHVLFIDDYIAGPSEAVIIVIINLSV